MIERSGTNELGKGVRKGEEVRETKPSVPNPDKEDSMPGDRMTEAGLLDDFYYYPSSVQIPDIDVPDHLPNLPGMPTQPTVSL